MSRKTILCEHCDASYTIQHDQDEKFYFIKYCPFCGDNIPQEDEYNIIEDNDYE